MQLIMWLIMQVIVFSGVNQGIIHDSHKHLKDPQNTPSEYMIRPIALMPFITKCFEKLVLALIKSIIPATLGQHQFA